jgi:hypothetical protein
MAESAAAAPPHHRQDADATLIIAASAFLELVMANAMDRAAWVGHVDKIARPVLAALAAENLRGTMPVEQKGERDRRGCSHLEAFGRLLAGISPWLASGADDAGRVELAGLAQRALENGVNPKSPDFLNFSEVGQPLVDAAFLSHAILRAPGLLWEPLSKGARANLVNAMLSTRVTTPGASNWLLFSAMVEAFLAFAGERFDGMRVDYAIRQHMQWYKGDGIYGDGANFHWDYYNSFVIQPMLLDVLTEMRKHDKRWDEFAEPVVVRAQRYAVIQERFISPDGSFPPIGRSLAYRCGAFQLLAQMALQKKLPAELKAGQVRTALSAVIERTLSAPGTSNDAGWLRIGLCGHQPGLGEGYISTGSLYLCSVAFLPLGLPAGDEFWAGEPLPTTMQKIWSGQDAPADHAIYP